jgi:hypothetical protein
MANCRVRLGEAVREVHLQADRRGRGERPEVFPLRVTDIGQCLCRSERDIERLPIVAEEARAAMPPCGAYLLPSRLGLTSGHLTGGPQAIVQGRASEDQLKHGILFVVLSYRMRHLGTTRLECRLQRGKVR